MTDAAILTICVTVVVLGGVLGVIGLFAYLMHLDFKEKQK